MRFLLFFREDYFFRSGLRESGFTLIELLLIVVLIGVVSIAAINAFDGNEEQARENITRLEMVELQKALLQFRRDNREFPCMVYRSGTYNPFEFRAGFSDTDFIDGFTFPASGASRSDWQGWCGEAFEGTTRTIASNALYILNTFPYEITNHAELTWNRSTQLGWKGPYISQEGLTDGWGNPYLLLEPELSYEQTYRCENDTGAYAIDGSTGEYVCLSVHDPAFNDSTDILPANIARIVSMGSDGVIQSGLSNYTLPTDDPCIAQGDDFVLCLLR
jgi:type II secretory pathway pseudopilin PulG